MPFNEYCLLDPRELGEPHYGAEGFDVDLHGPKYKRITPQMQEQERLDERRRNGLYFDEPVHDAQNRLLDLIPKNNLCIPLNWFHFESDAEKVFKAAARTHDVAINRVGTTRLTTCLCMFLGVVSKHRDLRLRGKGDPPHMSLQERRERHWQAVIDESSFARDFSQRLVRHVTLMLVSAHVAFYNLKGPRNKNKELNDKITKVSEWFEENDPEDVRSFEYLEAKRPEVRAVRKKGNNKRQGNRYSRKRATGIPGPIVRPNCPRQRYTPLSPRPSRTLRAPANPPQYGQVELPERLADSKGRKRRYDERE
ncbi:hypothetical protein KVR01_012345 [Diaporthe batatas]|uniref:uncharacterized protein n=1 Tax=Diaporthe batatas TaxID=748121 RepID=UPI001D04459A|nr:uncharacterized protein KVR01_012345 [Diaporthe batatas]KAG8157683.1 hypothetical protein KVR01_012345 [Diaporthe batatas]